MSDHDPILQQAKIGTRAAAFFFDYVLVIIVSSILAQLLDVFIVSTFYQNVKADSIIPDSVIYWMLGGSAVFVSICGLLATLEKNRPILFRSRIGTFIIVLLGMLGGGTVYLVEWAMIAGSADATSRGLIRSAYVNLFGITLFLSYWLYFAILESSEMRATVGKIILGIVVTDTEGNKISFARATVRFFIRWILIHNVLCKTVVIKKTTG